MQTSTTLDTTKLRAALPRLALAIFLAAPASALADEPVLRGAPVSPAVHSIESGPGPAHSSPNAARIRVPHSFRRRSRQMILEFAPPKTRELIVSYEQEIRQINQTPNLSPEQRRRRDALIRTHNRIRREIVLNHPNLKAMIERTANSHRYRKGVMLARKLMNHPETYNRVISRADPQTADIIARNNSSLREVSSLIKQESASDHKSCNAHRMDALYKRMSRILDNQINALERTGLVRTNHSE